LKTLLAAALIAAVGPELVSYSIAVGPGLAGSFQPRAMRGDAASLQYNLYAEPSRSVVLGDGTAGTVTVGGQLSLPGQASRETVLYGRIPPRQPAIAGAYTDVLTISIEF
jgi:spore coat protein U-like protein